MVRDRQPLREQLPVTLVFVSLFTRKQPFLGMALLSLHGKGI